MKTFKELLNEIFNQVPHKVLYYGNDSDHGKNKDKLGYQQAHTYEFYTKHNKRYEVNIDHHGVKNEKTGQIENHATVNFHRNIKGTTYQHATRDTNEESHHAFGGVHHIVKDHLKKNPHISHVTFDSMKQEPKRVKLYSSILKKLAHHHSEEDKIGKGQTPLKKYTVATKDLK